MIKVFQSYILLSVLLFMISCGSDNVVNPEYSYINGTYDIDNSRGGNIFDIDTIEYVSSGLDYIKIGKYKFEGEWNDSAKNGSHQFISLHQMFHDGHEITFQVKFFYFSSGNPGSFYMTYRDADNDRYAGLIELFSRRTK